jgi:hypothetical protein
MQRNGRWTEAPADDKTLLWTWRLYDLVISFIVCRSALTGRPSMEIYCVALRILTGSDLSTWS